MTSTATSVLPDSNRGIHGGTTGAFQLTPNAKPELREVHEMLVAANALEDPHARLAAINLLWKRFNEIKEGIPKEVSDPLVRGRPLVSGIAQPTGMFDWLTGASRKK